MKKAVLIFIMAALVGCGGDKNEGESADTSTKTASSPAIGDTTQIMPLTLGNFWVIKYSQFDTLANAFVDISLDTFLVTGDTLVDNETWFFVKNMTPEGGRVVNRTDGLWQYREGVEPFLFLKFPVEKGAEYSTKIGPTEVENRVTETDLKVSVPAGEFSCYKYTHFVRQHDLVVDFYFQPGVGAVKMELYSNGGMQPISKHELIEYKLK